MSPWTPLSLGLRFVLACARVFLIDCPLLTGGLSACPLRRVSTPPLGCQRALLNFHVSSSHITAVDSFGCSLSMPAFEPTARYAGPRAGMVFTTRDGATGYYADAAAQLSRGRRADDFHASSSSASSLVGRDAKRRREKRREKKERKREKKRRKKEKKRRKKEKRKRKRSASSLVLVLVLLGERRRPLGRLGQADQAQGRQVGRGPRARRRPPRDAALHERRLRALAVSVFCELNLTPGGCRPSRCEYSWEGPRASPIRRRPVLAFFHNSSPPSTQSRLSTPPRRCV